MNKNKKLEELERRQRELADEINAVRNMPDTDENRLPVPFTWDHCPHSGFALIGVQWLTESQVKAALDRHEIRDYIDHLAAALQDGDVWGGYGVYWHVIFSCWVWCIADGRTDGVFETIESARKAAEIMNRDGIKPKARLGGILKSSIQ